ncbi:MAG: hypothetical protein ACK5MN_10505 [Lachnospiraceae bacterium]
MDTAQLYRRRHLLRLEQYVRERCLHRVVKNDGMEIRQMLERDQTITDFSHKGNFVFEVKMHWPGTMLIWTEPMDEEGEYIRIIGYSIEP